MGQRPGHHLVTCDLSGWVFWDDEVKTTWDGMVVGAPFYEARHPQDFVRGKVDKQSVEPSRPEPTDTFRASCTLSGRNGIAGMGSAGCAITGLKLPI